MESVSYLLSFTLFFFTDKRYKILQSLVQYEPRGSDGVDIACAEVRVRRKDGKTNDLQYHAGRLRTGTVGGWNQRILFSSQLFGHLQAHFYKELNRDL